MSASRIILPLLLLAFAVGPANALASENANWGTGVEVTPPANAASNPDVFISHLTCTSAGNCTTAGLYTDSSGDRQVFFLTEASGMWGTAQEAALPADTAPNSEVGVGSLSCSSEGNCAAVGEYVDSSGEQQGVLWSETSGMWATGLKAPLPANAGSEPEVFIGQVSCQSAGNCTAAGRYSDSTESQQGLLLSETSGTWETGVEATLPANAAEPGAGVFMNGLSCPSAGNCTAVGNYSGNQGDYESFLLTETSGIWGAAVEATPPADAESRLFLDGVSCPSIGNCTAVGDYFDSKGNQGLLLSESSGVWGTAIKAPLPANGLSEPYVFIHTVQCASAGNCTAVGNYIANSTQGEGLLLTETSGKWATGVEAPVPANARTDPFVTGGALSCPSAGNCGVVHHYDDSASHFQGLLLTESSGSWGPGLEAALPANAASNPEVSLGSVSCTSPDNCIAVGSYSDSSGHQQGLVLAAAPIAPTLSAKGPAGGFAGDPIAASSISAALAEGSSPSGTITFTVFGPQASPPSSCASGGITLGTASAAGEGTYHPSGAFTPTAPGDYWWYASYGGDPGDEPAASPCGAEMEETIVVPKATPALSTAGPIGALAGSPISASTISATLGRAAPPRPERSHSRCSARSPRRPARARPGAPRSAPRMSTATGLTSHPPASPRRAPVITGGMPATAAMLAMNRPPRHAGRGWQRQLVTAATPTLSLNGRRQRARRAARSRPPRSPRRSPRGPPRPERSRSRCSARRPRRPARAPRAEPRSAPRASTVTGPTSQRPASPPRAPATTGGMRATVAMPATIRRTRRERLMAQTLVAAAPTTGPGPGTGSSSPGSGAGSGTAARTPAPKLARVKLGSKRSGGRKSRPEAHRLAACDDRGPHRADGQSSQARGRVQADGQEG